MDREWLEAANPKFVQHMKQKAHKEETLFKKRQLTRTLKAVQQERKAGIRVSRVPPELEYLVTALCD